MRLRHLALLATACTTDDAAPPADLAAAVVAERDPVRQFALLRDYAGRPGSDLAAVCAALPAGEAARECAELRARPHLRGAREVPDRGRDFGGLRLPQDALGPLAAVAPTLGPGCAAREDVESATCQAEWARELAAAGRPEEAAAACAGAGSGRDECLFRASEAVLERPDAGAAASLCLASRRFGVQCFVHLGRRLARDAPAPLPARAAEWLAFADRIEASCAGAGPAGDAFTAALRERLWAQALAASVWQAPRVDGAVLAHLPAEARPHFGAALALRLCDPGQPLETQVARVLTGLAGAIDLGPQGEPELTERETGWNPRTEAEERLPTVTHLRARRRVVSSDPAEDAAICVLEALDARGGAPMALLEQALAHPSVLVRWTAARLIPPGEAGMALRTIARADTEALVLDRAWPVARREPRR